MFRLLELCAGYGSQAMALKEIGLDVYSEIAEFDKYASLAYNQMHGETKNYGDIYTIDEKKLPYFDMITYSTPCQDFSIAGKQQGGEKGTGTRSSLLWECERIIRAVKPKYLLMENVKNLMSDKFRHTFNEWFGVLESMGYKNYYKVLNAKDYGVPQNRERIFCVSVLGDEQFLFPNPIKLEKRLKDVLDDTVDEKYYLSNRTIDFYLKNTEKQAENGNGFRFSPTDGNCVAKTITTRAGGRMDDNYIEEPLAYDEQNQYLRKDGCVGTLTTDGSSPKHNNRVVEPSPIRLGNIYNPNYGTGYAGNVWSKSGLSPTITTAQGGGREPMIIVHNGVNIVRVRKYDVDVEGLKAELRSHKTLTNFQIAEKLGVPLTKVEHWFRNDSSFAIPDENVWDNLKDILGIKTDKFDKSIKTFEEKDGTYDKANRFYDEKGIAPTLTCTSADEKICTNYRIRKLTPHECFRLMGVPDKYFNRLHDLSNAQLYKMAGNSIVVDVLKAIFTNLLKPEEVKTVGQLTLL